MRGRKAKIPKNLYNCNFRSLAKTEQNASCKIRLLGLAHVKEGKSFRDISKMLHVHEKTVRNWVRKFAKNGLEELKLQPGRGRKKKLAPNQEEAFRASILELQKHKKGGRVRGLDIQEHMMKELGIECSLRAVYRYLKHINFVWISARSKHPNADIELQEAFKKTSSKK